MAMMTRGDPGEAGFTLIEVLAAMVVLAVGLLTVQALGIVAARTITRAERQSELTAAMVSAVERRDAAARAGSPPSAGATACEVGLTSGVEVCTSITGGDAGSSPPLLRFELRAAHLADASGNDSLLWFPYAPPLP